MLIRIDQVEDLYHKASFFEPKYHKTTPTIGISLEAYLNDGQEHRLALHREEDLPACARQLLALFELTVEPFFQRYARLEELEKEVNVAHRKSIFSGPKFEGCVGLILAKLVGNPDYEQLKGRYYKYYEWFAGGFYLPEYEGVIAQLETPAVIP